VTRHGCRYPRSELQIGCVKELFRGPPMNLTMKGEREMEELGSVLRLRYQHLLSREEGIILHCSPLQRSVASSLALLRGLSPESRALFIASGGARSCSLVSPQLSHGLVPLTIEGDEDVLFHGGLNLRELKEYQLQQVKKLSNELQEYMNLEELMCKLYRTTSIPSLSPATPLEDRVKVLKSLHNLVVTAENEEHEICGGGLLLSDEERLTLATAASLITRSKYPRNHQGMKFATFSCSHLRHQLYHLALNGEFHSPSFVHYSAHESTIISLTTALSLHPSTCRCGGTGGTESERNCTPELGDAPYYGALVLMEVYLPLKQVDGSEMPLISLKYYIHPSLMNNEVISPTIPFHMLPSREGSERVLHALSL